MGCRCVLLNTAPTARQTPEHKQRIRVDWEGEGLNRVRDDLNRVGDDLNRVRDDLNSVRDDQ
jgi:hypothetical protein